MNRIPPLPACLAFIFVVALSTPTYAGTAYLDQIGLDPNTFTGSGAGSENYSDLDHEAVGVFVVDNFTLPTAVTLTDISAVIDPTFGYQLSGEAGLNPALLTGFDVNIYNENSRTVAYTANFLMSQYLFQVTPYGTNPDLELISFPVYFTLPQGSYGISVSADGTYLNGFQVQIATKNGSGGNDAVQLNPGGDLGYTNNELPLNADAAYEVIGVPVPEPSQYGLAIALGVAGFILTKRFRSNQGTSKERQGN